MIAALVLAAMTTIPGLGSLDNPHPTGCFAQYEAVYQKIDQTGTPPQAMESLGVSFARCASIDKDKVQVRSDYMREISCDKNVAVMTLKGNDFADPPTSEKYYNKVFDDYQSLIPLAYDDYALAAWLSSDPTDWTMQYTAAAEMLATQER